MCHRFIPNAGSTTKAYSDDGFSVFLTYTWPCSCRESYQVILGEHLDDDVMTDFFACKDYYASLVSSIK